MSISNVMFPHFWWVRGPLNVKILEKLALVICRTLLELSVLHSMISLRLIASANADSHCSIVIVISSCIYVRLSKMYYISFHSWCGFMCALNTVLSCHSMIFVPCADWIWEYLLLFLLRFENKLFSTPRIQFICAFYTWILYFPMSIMYVRTCTYIQTHEYSIFYSICLFVRCVYRSNTRMYYFTGSRQRSFHCFDHLAAAAVCLLYNDTNSCLRTGN